MLEKYSGYIKPVIVTALLLAMGAAQADNVTLLVSGSINAKTCNVNSGNPVDIDFKNIPVAEISDAKYQIFKEVTVDCDFNTGIPYVKVIGTPLGSDGNVVATNIANFGIALYQGSNLAKPLLLGEGKESAGQYYGYRIGYGLTGMGEQIGVLSFTAVPYVLGNTAPNSGQFSATATLSFNYL